MIDDGSRLRMFAGESGSDTTWQVVYEAGAWGDWEPVFSDGKSGRQPVAAVAEGDVNLITSSAGTSIFEQLVR